MNQRLLVSWNPAWEEGLATLLKGVGLSPIREAIPEEVAYLVRKAYDEDRLTIVLPPWWAPPTGRVARSPGGETYEYTHSRPPGTLPEVLLPDDSKLLVCCRRDAQGRSVGPEDMLLEYPAYSYFGIYLGCLVRTSDDRLRRWCDEPDDELPPFVSFSLNMGEEPATSYELLVDEDQWSRLKEGQRPRGELRTLLSSLWAKLDEERRDPGSARALQDLSRSEFVIGPQLYGITGALIYERGNLARPPHTIARRRRGTHGAE